MQLQCLTGFNLRVSRNLFVVQDCARSSFAASGKAQVSVVLDLNRYLELLDTVEVIEEDNHNEN